MKTTMRLLGNPNPYNLYFKHTTEVAKNSSGHDIWELKRVKNSDGIFNSVHCLVERRVTYATLISPNGLTWRGIAKCHPNDNKLFNKETGRKLSLKNLFKNAEQFDKNTRKELWKIALPKRKVT